MSGVLNQGGTGKDRKYRELVRVADLKQLISSLFSRKAGLVVPFFSNPPIGSLFLSQISDYSHPESPHS